ncbi:Ribosomal silencing factor RsfS [Limihaloglobus sulfuriphilus]|uniref:Ribosomal silencing factor RsfS n=1 Tax=Limihaloglobus sulfuriphilus TaxID=1851148 RepID=A0A1Q2MC05_9BACT|nr:ribosome silencing factor [Limihaloglobus sulfuriphilus]AQQ69807.1 Ribosomal silencing factor RsfS [Limihaloglobus sulfuriphilus]
MIQDKEKRKQQAKEAALIAAKIAIDRNCKDVVVMDLLDRSPATDFFVIATGTSARQTRTVAEEIIRDLRGLKFRPFGKAGYEDGNWILVDFVTVVVHLFNDEYREYYDLEMLWGDAEKLDLEGITGNEADN